MLDLWKRSGKALALTGLFALIFSASALAVVQEGYFELDGNAVNDGIADDWEDVYNDCGIGGPCPPVTTGAKRQSFQSDATDPDATHFTGGMKDILPMSSWECTTVNNPQSKSDIQYAYGAVYEGATGKILYAGMDRQDVNGTSYMGVWLLQTPAGCVSAGGATPFTGQHLDGDLLLIINYENGGSVATVNAYRWTDPDFIPENGDECLGGARGAVGTECSNEGLEYFSSVSCDNPLLPDPPLNDLLCGISNGGDGSNQTPDNEIEVPWRGPGDLVGENGFFEAAANLTAAALEDSVSGSECYSSVMIETRSSAELTADLKDFVFLDLATCGTITIEKETNQPVGDLFPFTITDPVSGLPKETGESNTTEFSLAGGDSIFLQAVETDTYVFTEGALPSDDWSLASISCVDGFGADPGYTVDLDLKTVNVALETEDDITCTFVNELAPPPGSLLISKSCDTTSGNTDSWTFSISGPEGSVANSTCPTGSVTLSCGESTSCEGLLPGEHTVDEDEPLQLPWELTDVTCSGGVSTNCAVNIGGTDATVTLGDQEGVNDSATVAFTNRENANIQVCKNTIPADVGGDFTFTSNWGMGSPFNLAHGECTTANAVEPDGTTYTFTEADKTGYTLGNASCTGSTNWSLTGATLSVTPDPGESIVCTFTNTEDPGSITVCKDTVPTGSSTTFLFELSGPSPQLPSSATLVDGECSEPVSVVVGTGYAIAETAVEGWDLTSATCDDGSSVDNIGISAAEDVTCTFTNTQRGRIRVVKNAVGGDDTFAFTASYGDFNIATSGGTGENLSGWLVPGDYTVAEGTLPIGWEASGVTCNDDDGDDTNLNLDPGEEITCTFTNTRQGSITVVKNTIGGDGTFDFTRSFGADFQVTTTNGSGQVSFALLSPGNYSVAESDPGAGWNLESATCTGSMSPDAITLAADGAVVCTFTNRKLVPSISITKSPAGQTIAPGETADFTILVENTGEVALENVVVTDALAPDCDFTLVGTFPVDGSFTYDCSLANVQSSFTNVAEVTGDPVGGGDPVTDSDTAVVNIWIPTTAVPVDGKWALLLLVLSILTVAWYRRP